MYVQVFGRVEFISIHVTIINFRNSQNEIPKDRMMRKDGSVFEINWKLCIWKIERGCETLDSIRFPSHWAHMTCKTVIAIDAETN